MTEDPRTIADFWASYRRSVVPRDASPVQVQECRRAFYAGATALLAGMMGAAEGDGDPTEQDYRRMEDLAGELARFAEGAARGAA
jgi:hypothetical protein